MSNLSFFRKSASRSVQNIGGAVHKKYNFWEEAVNRWQIHCLENHSVHDCHALRRVCLIRGSQGVAQAEVVGRALLIKRQELEKKRREAEEGAVGSTPNRWL